MVTNDRANELYDVIATALAHAKLDVADSKQYVLMLAEVQRIVAHDMHETIKGWNE